jgi:hypothetical protein
VNSSAITPVVNAGDKIIFTLSGLTGGSGSYSYKWEDGVSVGSVLSTTNKYEIPEAVAGVAYAINVTIADSNNPVNVKTIYCSIVSVNSVSSLLDLKIGPTIPAANDVIFRVRKGDRFALSWINKYPLLPASLISCTASISNEDLVDWSGWKTAAINGDGNNVYETINALEGDHIFTLSCGEGVTRNIIKKVTLQVYSVSGGEI